MSRTCLAVCLVVAVALVSAVACREASAERSIIGDEFDTMDDWHNLLRSFVSGGLLHLGESSPWGEAFAYQYSTAIYGPEVDIEVRLMSDPSGPVYDGTGSEVPLAVSAALPNPIDELFSPPNAYIRNGLYMEMNLRTNDGPWFVRRVDGTWPQPGHSPTECWIGEALDPFVWYTVLIQIREDHVRVLVDGEEFGVAPFSIPPNVERRLWLGEYYGQAVVDYIRVTEPNSAPVAVAGGPYGACVTSAFVDVNPNTLNINSNGKWVTGYFTVDPGGTALVQLDGSGSYDPDGDPLVGYHWLVMEAESADEIAELEGISPSIELPPGEYVVGLVVDDGELLSTNDAFAPIAVSAPDLQAVDPTAVVLNGAVSGEWGQMQDAATLMVKFSRELLVPTLIPEQENLIEVSGALTGADTIMVIDRGDKGKGKKK